jgi:FkbM family methyltransferase
MILGRYEEFLTQSIFQTFADRGVFVDVGANVGYFSRRVARQFRKARVFAIEPNPRIYPLLEKNLSGCPNCELLQAGLGAKDASLDFYHGEESCVGSFVQEYTSHHPANKARGEIATSKVRVVTGDAALSQAGIIDVMKIDVEGYESKVLKGMANLLGKGAIKTIFFEFFPSAQRSANSQPEEIIRFLARSSYVIQELEGEQKGALVTNENVGDIIGRLGSRGYTTLRADVR